MFEEKMTEDNKKELLDIRDRLYNLCNKSGIYLLNPNSDDKYAEKAGPSHASAVASYEYAKRRLQVSSAEEMIDFIRAGMIRTLKSVITERQNSANE